MRPPRRGAAPPLRPKGRWPAVRASEASAAYCGATRRVRSRNALVRCDRGALARDDQHELRSVFGGAPEEMVEPPMGLRLGQAMKIEDVVHLRLARGQATLEPPLQWRERRQSGRAGFALFVRRWRRRAIRHGGGRRRRRPCRSRDRRREGGISGAEAFSSRGRTSAVA